MNTSDGLTTMPMFVDKQQVLEALENAQRLDSKQKGVAKKLREAAGSVLPAMDSSPPAQLIVPISSLLHIPSHNQDPITNVEDGDVFSMSWKQWVYFGTTIE